MEERPVVTCFLRHAGEVLLLRRSDAVGSYSGQWGGVAGHVADDAGRHRDPETAARAEIAEETGLADAVALVERGASFPVDDPDVGIRWLVHPFLFDCDSRSVQTNAETAETSWVQPPEILRRETVPRLWTSYDRVRPRVATVADDRTHGSTWLSRRALAVLRDEAALAAVERWDGFETAERSGDDWTALTTLAVSLRDARPSMAVVENRVNRAMATASEEATPAAVERAARETLTAAVEADDAAADAVAPLLGERVATLSRSGTVLRAIEEADSDAVLLAESRPGGEGRAVASSLAAERTVTLTTDAAFAGRLAAFAPDALVVGADTILPDGRVVNKVGTYAAALAAERAGVPAYAVAASDKIRANDQFEQAEREPAELYDGEAPVGVSNPTFEAVPAALLTLVTEHGRLSADDISAIAAEHRKRASWNNDESDP